MSENLALLSVAIGLVANAILNKSASFPITESPVRELPHTPLPAQLFLSIRISNPKIVIFSHKATPHLNRMSMSMASPHLVVHRECINSLPVSNMLPRHIPAHSNKVVLEQGLLLGAVVELPVAILLADFAKEARPVNSRTYLAIGLRWAEWEWEWEWEQLAQDRVATSHEDFVNSARLVNLRMNDVVCSSQPTPYLFNPKNKLPLFEAS